MKEKLLNVSEFHILCSENFNLEPKQHTQFLITQLAPIKQSRRIFSKRVEYIYFFQESDFSETRCIFPQCYSRGFHKISDTVFFAFYCAVLNTY